MVACVSKLIQLVNFASHGIFGGSPTLGYTHIEPMLRRKGFTSAQAHPAQNTPTHADSVMAPFDGKWGEYNQLNCPLNKALPLMQNGVDYKPLADEEKVIVFSLALIYLLQIALSGIPAP
jgi:hypothetical protein